MGKHVIYYELRDALHEEGCPLCWLIQKVIARYLDFLVYENVNDPGVRENIREARGFCNLHAWQLRDVRGALGIAIIHRDVLETLMRRVKAGAYNENSWLPGLDRVRTSLGGTPASAATTDLVADLSPQRACPACRVRDNTEMIYVHTLLAHMDDPELGPALRHSAGLCLPHFRLALEQVPDRTTFETLVDIQTEVWQRLRDELSEFIRKQDYQFRDEDLGAEGDSWIRAITQISGARGVR